MILFGKGEVHSMVDAQIDEHEEVVGTWRRSPWTIGFWARTLSTLGIWALFLWRRNQIIISTRRVTHEQGDLLGGEETSLSLNNITDVTIDIPPLGALFKYGNIRIQTAGSNDAEINFEGIQNPRQLRETIYDVKDGRLDEGGAV
jgi:membrane protein YdbS with pleckstrin-like domain